MTNVPALAPEVDLLGRIQTGAPVRVGDLTLFPLLAPGTADADLLEEALLRGTRVTEVSDAGEVNSVRIVHPGPRPLLIVDGEEIVGSKQNRVFNASFLIPPDADVVIPVSCVERGRWNYRSETFDCASRVLAPSLRNAKLHRVTTSVRCGRNYDADQRAVWLDVDDHLTRTNVVSRSSAYADAADRATPAREALLQSLAPIPGQAGIASLRRSKLVAVDLFGSPGLYGRAWKKIVRGLIAELTDPGSISILPNRSAARSRVALARALTSLGRQPFERHRAPGCGDTVHAASASLVASGIAHEGHVFHLVIGSPP